MATENRKPKTILFSFGKIVFGNTPFYALGQVATGCKIYLEKAVLLVKIDGSMLNIEIIQHMSICSSSINKSVLHFLKKSLLS